MQLIRGFELFLMQNESTKWTDGGIAFDFILTNRKSKGISEKENIKKKLDLSDRNKNLIEFLYS